MPGQRKADDFRAVTLTTPAQYAEAAALYRAVFGYRNADYALNPRLLGALVANGGSVVGVLDPADRIVAVAYGFCGTDGHNWYHYSQSAVVASDLQGLGLGRLLKRAQREIALRNGVTHMRWTYDPFQTRNGHFNFDVLGARGRWFKQDMYGEAGTDRVIVEWDLRQEAAPKTRPPVPLTRADWGLQGGDADEAWLALPADFAGLATARPEVAERVRHDVRSAFTDLFGKGLVAVSCRRAETDPDTAVYYFEPANRPADPGPSAEASNV